MQERFIMKDVQPEAYKAMMALEQYRYIHPPGSPLDHLTPYKYEIR